MYDLRRKHVISTDFRQGCVLTNKVLVCTETCYFSEFFFLCLHLLRQVLAHHRPPPRPHLPPVPRPHQGLLLLQRRPRHWCRPVRGLPVRLSLQPHPVSIQSHGAAHTARGLHHMDWVGTGVGGGGGYDFAAFFFFFLLIFLNNLI